VVDKVALGQVFSEYFGFPCPIFIPPISPQSPSPIIRGWYNRPVVAAWIYSSEKIINIDNICHVVMAVTNNNGFGLDDWIH
jgi:hypothetical protein